MTWWFRGTIAGMVDWPHAPLHRFSPHGIYFVTASTYLKRHYYPRAADLNRIRDTLFGLARDHECRLQAWALMSNHYHLVAECAGPVLRSMLAKLHQSEGFACNQRDGVVGRKVWFQFRETELTFEKSWLARLRYTHENPVHHGLVLRASNYPWCSAGWFERSASTAFAKTLASFKIDRLNVADDFEPIPHSEE
jgi:putative transposase